MDTDRHDPARHLAPPIRWVLAALSLGAAAIHFAVMGDHFRESAAHGAFFAATGWLQVAFAFAVVLRPSTPLLRLGALGNAMVVGAWAVSRLWGVPIGEHPWTPEPAGAADVLATALEATLVVGCLRTAGAAADDRRWRSVAAVQAGALALTVAVASTLALVPAVAGSAHQHGAEDAGAGGHDHAADRSQHGGGMQAADGTSPCERSGPPVTSGQVDATHGHRGPTPWKPIDAETRAVLGAQLELARQAAARFPTVATARAAGYVRSSDYLPCIGAHYTKPSLIDDVFDPLNPEALVYDSVEDDGRIVGLTLGMTDIGREPEGFAGPNDRWHQHVGLCVGSDGQALGIEGTSEAACRRRGGTTSNDRTWMTHAWVVPGWESAWGPFSGEHPELGAAPPR